jgi:hypothetical protein
VERLKGVYGWGRVVVRFAVTNSKTKDLIACPCKKYSLNKSLRLEEVYDYLTGGSEILTSYTE